VVLLGGGGWVHVWVWVGGVNRLQARRVGVRGCSLLVSTPVGGVRVGLWRVREGRGCRAPEGRYESIL
jgi:hypothetical protein